MVSIFSGMLTRTWKFTCDEITHQIRLHHDTITGTRALLLDNEEIPSTYGISNIFMDSEGDVMIFRIGEHHGFVEIRKVGWLRFKYSCYLEGELVTEVTYNLASNQGNKSYEFVIENTCFSADHITDKKVVWYQFKVKRLSDSFETIVHR